MEEMRRETLRKLVDVNDNFSKEVCEGKAQVLDLYVSFELALLFFKLHEDDLASLDEADRSCVCALMDSTDYVLDGSFVFVEGKLYDLRYVLSLIDKVKKVNQDVRSDKVIFVDFRENKSGKTTGFTRQGKTKIYDIRNILNDTTFTYEERAYILERTLRVDTETRPFIEENRERFISRISCLIQRLVAGEELDGEDNYVQLLVSILKMYPFVKYGSDLVSLEKLKLPQSEIGLAKFVIQDEFVFKLEEYMRELQRERKEYVKQYFSFHDCVGKLRKMAEIAENQIREIDIKLQECSWRYYAYVHDVDVYNKCVLSYLMRSVLQGNVYMNEDGVENPTVKFFTLAGEEILFFGAMHLNLFKTLIDSHVLLSFDGKKVLEKKK